MIRVDLSKALLRNEELAALQPKLAEIHKKIHQQDANVDNAWVELPNTIDAAELQRIQATAQWVRENYDVLLVIGVGGSYLGAYAGLQLLCDTSSFPVEFLGTSFDPAPIIKFLQKYKDKRICVNVISKSGTTLEVSAAFNIISTMVDKEHLIFTTDVEKGYLRQMAKDSGITTFTVPDRVGGRYSVLSSVGLLPFAVAGIDIDAIVRGAKQASIDCARVDNEAYKYAAARFLLHTKHKKSVEVLASFHEGMVGVAAWWQQLFGESEGKNGEGLFVSPMVFSRDLHSMGQYIQQGSPILFETILNITESGSDVMFHDSENKATEVPAKFMSQLNKAAFLGTLKAHSDAGVPVVVLNFENASATGFGYLIYFFEIAVAASAYLLGVNPFDQPGVEFYKKNMRDLL